MCLKRLSGDRGDRTRVREAAEDALPHSATVHVDHVSEDESIF